DRPAGWGLAQQQDYVAHRYHKPADVYDPAWDLSGMVEQLGLLYQTGRSLADGDGWPTWKDGGPFAAARRAERGSP
ncbi:MAG TPA: peptidase M28, partial [Gammaproteobacteria bacterium]|nr:peptidase M28 [Gammaproteobacteria bacterium]